MLYTQTSWQTTAFSPLNLAKSSPLWLYQAKQRERFSNVDNKHIPMGKKKKKKKVLILRRIVEVASALKENMPFT